MAYSILIAGAIAAKDLDSLVKSAKNDLNAMENGNIFYINGNSAVSGEGEVVLAATPVTATLGTDVFYMVNDPINVLVNSIYSGLIDDPREFNIAAGKIFSSYKPMVGDEIILTADGLAGTKGSNSYIIPANGALELTWGASISGVSLAYQYVSSQNIPIGNTRVTGYRFRCIKA
jgi:hypothetical protein